jgi:Tfp pilus assembly protein PilV
LKEKEAARQTLAEWDVAEEMEEMQMDADSTQRLSAALRKGYRKREPETGSEGELFEFNAMDLDASDAASELEELEPVKKSKVRS